MSARALAILRTGLNTAVGADAPSSCAAFRSKVTNPTPTLHMDCTGEWIMAHQVETAETHRDIEALSDMAAAACLECLNGIAVQEWARIPLLLCVAEQERPGRLDGLDEGLFEGLTRRLGSRFAATSLTLPHGRVGVAAALQRTRQLVDAQVPLVLIVAVDSLITWPTLMHFDRVDRLLRSDNSNGFIPGEGAGALLVGAADVATGLLCTGIGFAREAATIETELPLRADGLTAAIRAAAGDAGWNVSEFDYRISDLSGEQYYFKEAALALQRTLHRRKEAFDLWHPAECIGEAGALAGAAVIALADSASRLGYGAGPRILAHLCNDGGERAAIALQYRGAR